jgi:hypothetical protein
MSNFQYSQPMAFQYGPQQQQPYVSYQPQPVYQGFQTAASQGYNGGSLHTADWMNLGLNYGLPIFMNYLMPAIMGALTSDRTLGQTISAQPTQQQPNANELLAVMQQQQQMIAELKEEIAAMKGAGK